MAKRAVQLATGDDALPPRDRHKRPLIRPVGGDGKSKAYRRPSSYVGNVTYGPGLTFYSMVHALMGLAESPKDFERLQDIVSGGMCSYEQVKADRRMRPLIERLKRMGGIDVKPTRGSQVHELTECVDLGRPIPDGLRDVLGPRVDQYVAMYQDVLADLGLRPVMVEQFLVSDEFEAAGTADRVYECDLVAPDGERVTRVIGDIKTGQTRIDHAAQMAIYASANLYDHRDGSRDPINVSQGWAILVQMDLEELTCTPYWVSLEYGRTVIELSQWAKSVQSAKSMKSGFQPFTKGEH